MRKLTKTLISFTLMLAIAFGSGASAFAMDEETFADTSDSQPTYTVIDTIQTPYGEAYYVEKDEGRKARTLWDVADIAMAGVSWAEFFEEPSLANIGWAVLDTAACAPIIPSSAYIRRGGKKLLSPELLKKAMKSDPGLKKKLMGKLVKKKAPAVSKDSMKAYYKLVNKVSYSNNHTGRWVPANLKEKLAMESVLSEPSTGKILKISLKDSRWPQKNGWVKMSKNVQGIEIHYVYNTRTKVYDDFKFKN